MVLAVPVEFLSDQEAAAFGRYGGSVPQADLERFFFLDDGDRLLAGGMRGDHNRLALDALLVVPPGSRVSELERWRTGLARASGPQMVKALNRVAEIIGSGPVAGGTRCDGDAAAAG